MSHPSTCSRCNEPRFKLSWCLRHWRFNQMRQCAQHAGKIIPTVEHLERLANELSGMVCPACRLPMIWTGTPKSRVVSLQHDQDGTLRLICQSCNCRHANIGDAFYEILGPDRKLCRRCSTVKPLSEFHKRTKGGSYGGVRDWCKTCGYACVREYRRKSPRKKRPPSVKGIGRHHRICAECGAGFQTHYPDQKYCSRSCKVKASTARVDIARIRELYESGKTQAEIGFELGTTATVVFHAMRRAQIKSRPAAPRRVGGGAE